MSEILINAIKNVRPVESNDTNVRVSVPTQAESSTLPRTKQVIPNQEKPQSPQEKPQIQKLADNESSALINDMSTVSLQFRVDEKTKDVTIFVIDRHSKKVIRSIPANELAKMRAGDLLKLTA